MKKILIKGFTIIEILVVVSIIGILAAVVTVNYNDFKDDASNRAIQAEMKNLQLAIELYKADHGRYPSAKFISGRLFCGHENGSGIHISASGDDVIDDDDENFPGWSVGCAVDGNEVAIIEDLYPDYISEPLIIDHQKKSRNPDCILVYWVTESGEDYKFIAYRCHAGADDDEPEKGVPTNDQLFLCPLNRACIQDDPDSDVNTDLVYVCGEVWFDAGGLSFEPDEPEFFNSYAIYSEGAQCL